MRVKITWIKILHFFGIASLSLLEADKMMGLEELGGMAARLNELIDRRRDEIIDLNEEINEMKLRIENIKDSFNLKMEQITKVPIEKQKPISLRQPTWRRYQRNLEQQSHQRAMQLRHDIAEEISQKGAL